MRYTDNVVGNDSILDVMNCHPIKSVNDLPKGEYVIEPKLDGFRLLAIVADGKVEFYTRSKKRQDGKLPHLEGELLNFPEGTVFDGEIVALQQNADSTIVNDFEYVQSVMLSKPETAVRKQMDNRPLKYIAFDMLRYGKEDIRGKPYRDRVKAMNQVLGALDLKYAAASVSWPAEDIIHNFLVAKGFEGSIVKDVNAPYTSGARGAGWYKNKEQPTIDAVIVGYKPGNGKFLGQVGAVFFGQPYIGSPLQGMTQIEETAFLKKHKIAIHEIDGIRYVERGHASGMDDDERRFMTDNQDKLIGTVIEAGHNGIFPNRVKMRHPQFLRFREDKPASEVVWHDR